MISTLGSQDTQKWLHSSVQSFFTTCNWENETVAARSTPQDVQRLEEAAAIESFTELSFDLRVRQFFAAVNWEGTTISQSPAFEEPAPEPTNGFTLTDFSDLF
ncbi:MAG: hypothetical protein KME10_07570 [Plectolyngbya sp. WJT66-NPBG17]|jgi:hypothetical protein|nr:hypothetical protein [Plectolyngbya sp. WJT66-NPBG17]MBW4525355.1 hypothetical protein [Phormidium tanganyikae FI6-MK23]